MLPNDAMLVFSGIETLKFKKFTFFYNIEPSMNKI